jgi:hypothetical protein
MTAYGRFRKAQRMATPGKWWDRPQTGATSDPAARETATGESGTETGGQTWSLRDMCHT